MFVPSDAVLTNLLPLMFSNGRLYIYVILQVSEASAAKAAASGRSGNLNQKGNTVTSAHAVGTGASLATEVELLVRALDARLVTHATSVSYRCRNTTTHAS